MTNELKPKVFHVKLLLYLMGSLIAIYRSIDNVIRHNKLAVNDENKVKWNFFSSDLKPSFLIRYSRECKYTPIGILIDPTIKSATAKLTTK